MAREGLLTSGDVAKYLQCSVSTLRRMVTRDQIPYFRVGKLVRFRRADIDAWLTKYREGEQLPEAGRTPAMHPDQLMLFARELG